VCPTKEAQQYVDVARGAFGVLAGRYISRPIWARQE